MREGLQTPEQLWQAFLAYAATNVSNYVVETWLRPIVCLSFTNGNIELAVRDQFFRDWLVDHYMDILKGGLNQVTGGKVGIVWQIQATSSPSAQAHSPALPPAHIPPQALSESQGALGTNHNAGQIPEGSALGPREQQIPSHRISPPGQNPPMPASPPASGGGALPLTLVEKVKPVPHHPPHQAQTPGVNKSAKLSLLQKVQHPHPPHIVTVPKSLDAPDELRKQLNHRYIFDNFVVGPSNQFAFAACQAVAERPAESYNPLFLFGGVGLGKTHLLTAIGHRMLAINPQVRIVYASAEEFTNDVINAVLRSRLEDFRAKYRAGCDILLIDDIQLLAGKERTQHEFFHIFNTLYDSQRQIVVTSDKLPHEIPEIEDRLRNRFQWGLIADIQPPEMETRIAILRKKASLEKVTLSDDIMFFLARAIRSNVRELEGALVRLTAHVSLTQKALSLDEAKVLLEDIISSAMQPISIESIQRVVADYFQMRITDLKSKRRLKAVVRPRQIAMYLCRKHTDASFPELGSFFGHKDHTTIMSACSRIDDLVKLDQDVQCQVGELEKQLDNLPR